MPAERERENEAIYLYRLGPGQTRGTRGRTHALSRTHFEPKSEAEMGARGQDQTVLSIWVGPLGCHFSCPRGRVRMQGSGMGRSA
jgi:hypothetical protein